MSSRRLQRQQKPSGAPSRSCPQRTWLREQMREAFSRWGHDVEHGNVQLSSRPQADQALYVVGWLQSVAAFTAAELEDLERTGGKR